MEDLIAADPISARIRAQAGRWPSTQLGIGVVSRTTVDAAIELANQHGVDLMLIASRRQVDLDSLGAGYVCGWNAGRLAGYVRDRDAGGRVLLCRDHGGPWQNSVEIARGHDAARAMATAKDSFEEDIAAGFAVIHIDPTVGPDGVPAMETTMAELFELYDHCFATARRLGRAIAVEVGTEEQDAMSHDVTAFFEVLDRVLAFCRGTGVPRPLFVVAQTGTKVMEARNVGLLEHPYRIEGALPTDVMLPRLTKGLARRGVFLKQHNTDYLSDEALRWHPWLGIHAANVAPEFGVEESRALLRTLTTYGLLRERDAFLELAYASRKWEKWMLPGTHASDRDRAVIAGHYVFSTPAFAELFEAAESALRNRLDLRRALLDAVKQSILRYMTAFRLVGMPA